MDSEIAKKDQSLTTAEEMRNQIKLVMQPFANWEEYLTPVSLSIAILGELVCLSSNTDFSVNKNPPKGGYKYIRYPDSFRACLTQMCNAGWGAFYEALKNMDQIRLHTVAVPDYLQAAVKILNNGNSEVVQAHLPDQLEKIRVIADDCLELATVAENKFTNVINMVQELLEACVNAEFFYGLESGAIKKKLGEANLQKKSSEEAGKRSENAVKLMGKQLEKAHESSNKAMDSIPSVYEMIGMDLAENVTEALTTLINGVAARASENLQTGSGKGVNASQSKKSSADLVNIIHIYSKSAEILKYTENIKGFIKENAIIWKDLYDQKHKVTKTSFHADQLKRVKQSLAESPACTAKSDALSLCESGIKICDELGKYALQGKCEEAKTKELIKRIRTLNESARRFDSKSKDVTKTAAVAPKPPMMYKEGSESGKIKTSQRASDNARFKVEQSRAQMDKTRDVYEKSVENMERNQKELTAILVTMKTCDAKEIDFHTTMEILAKGMQSMITVKEQWEKMVHFFQMVSNIVKTSLKRTHKPVVSTSKKTQTLSCNAKLVSTKLPKTQASHATNIASLVHMISKTYTKVSTKRLIDHVSSLGELMTIDKSTSEFPMQMEQLRHSCNEAQKAILDHVLKNKEEFEKKSFARQEKTD